jgi:hypothetical protein
MDSIFIGTVKIIMDVNSSSYEKSGTDADNPAEYGKIAFGLSRIY